MLGRRWVGFVAGVFISLLFVVILVGLFLVSPSRFRTTIVASLFPHDLKLESAQETRSQTIHNIHGDVYPKSRGHGHGSHGSHGDHGDHGDKGDKGDQGDKVDDGDHGDHGDQGDHGDN